MTNATRPCPYCGAAALENAPHCGNCGRPLPDAPGAAKAAPAGAAKTMFGYVAPRAPSAPPQPPPPAPAPAPAPAYGAPPQQPPAPAPAYGAPPQQPPAPAPAYGAPPQQPPAPAYGAPPQQQPYGAPPQQPPPPAYGAPPQQQPYGAPPQHQPPPGPAYGAPPAYPQAYQGQPPPPAYPPSPYSAHIPGQAPSGEPALLGIGLSRFRDPQFQRLALMVAGAALLIGMVLPVYAGELTFGWSDNVFRGLLLPLVTGGFCLAYALIPGFKQAVPPLVAILTPFFLALIGLSQGSPMGSESPGMVNIAFWGYPVLIVGLVCHLSARGEVWPRYIIGVGGICTAPLFFFALGHTGMASGWFALAWILWVVLGAIGLLGLALVPTPEQVPALAKANAWAPWAAVAAILWLPATILAMALGLTSWSVAYGFTMLLHLLPIVAGYIAILVTVSPGAYEQLKQQLLSTSAAPPR